MRTKTIILNVTYLGQCGSGYKEKVTRKIELRETQTLNTINEAIIRKSFKWIDEHLYSFFMDNKPWSKNREMEYTRDWAKGDCEPGTKFAKIPFKGLNLKLNQKFSYVYDFGDSHQFEIQVVGFGEEDLREEYPRILESKGESPEQYPPCD